MVKTPLKAPVERSVLNKEAFLTIRKKVSAEVQSVFTGHDTYIGVSGIPADLYVNGELSVVGGAVGVLTLPDGTDTLMSGNAIDVEKIGSHYQINWTRGSELDAATVGISRLNSDLTQVQASLNEQITRINNDVIDDLLLVSGSVNALRNDFLQEISLIESAITSLSGSILEESNSRLASEILLSGSIARLSDSIALEAATRTSEVASIQTSVDFLLGVNSRLKSMGLYSFNEMPTVDPTNERFLSLSFEPSPASAVLLFQNGQLLIQGEMSDFTVEGNVLKLSDERALSGNDVFVATYPYAIPAVFIAFNEVLSFNASNGGNFVAQLSNVPTKPASVMLFQNGQLLSQGSEKDFLVSGRTVILLSSRQYRPEDAMIASYPYN